jgi:hypothetical protein
MTRKSFQWCLAAVALVSAITVYGGEWSIVTVEDMPEYFVAGKQASLRFTVRQHGMTLMSGAPVSVLATAPGLPEAKGTVSPTKAAGEYAALLTLPKAGEWTIRIETGLFVISGLLPVSAIQPGDAAPAPLSHVARGERLFVSKGCIGCHVNSEIAVKNMTTVGPDLTGRRFLVDYLRGVLADPSATLLRKPTETWEMPNLNLSSEDVAALVAYINRERPAAVSKAR